MAISIKMRGPTSLYNLWFTRYKIWPFLDQIWIEGANISSSPMCAILYENDSGSANPGYDIY